MPQIPTHKILDTITDGIMSGGGDTVVTDMLNDHRYGATSTWDIVREIVRMTLAECSQSARHRDMLVGLVDRLMAEQVALGLARVELTAAGMDAAEIDETIREFPDFFTPEGIAARRGPSPRVGPG